MLFSFLMLTEDISTQSYAGARHMKVKLNEKYCLSVRFKKISKIQI